MTRRTLALASVTTGMLLLLAYSAGAPWADGYAVEYGKFPMSRGEFALRMNLLWLALPASILFAVAAAAWRGASLLSIFDALGARPLRTAMLCGAIVFASSFTVRSAILAHTEVTDDENVYRLQAQLTSVGKLFVPSAPLEYRPFFDNPAVVNDGRRYGVVFVGHPAILAAAWRLGVENLLGPLQGALLVLLSALIALRTYGSRIATITSMLLAISPFLACISATRLSQPSSAVLLAAFTWAVLRIEDRPRSATWWVLAAASIVGAVFVRPHSALPFAIAIGAPLLWRLARREVTPSAAALASATALVVAGAALFLWINAARTGHPLQTGYALLDRGLPFPTGLFYSTRQLEQGLNHLNFWLFGWPLSLAFVPLFRRTSWGWRLFGAAALPALTFAATAIPTVAPVGPVYYGEAIGPLAILTASGLDRAVLWCRERIADATLTATVAGWPLAATLTGLLTFVPAQLVGLHQMAAITRRPYAVAAEARLENAVVFAGVMPARLVPPMTWAYAHRSADPELRDSVIFVRDLGPDRDRALARWLDRAGYMLRFDGKEVTFESLGPEAPPPTR